MNKVGSAVKLKKCDACGRRFVIVAAAVLLLLICLHSQGAFCFKPQLHDAIVAESVEYKVEPSLAVHLKNKKLQVYENKNLLWQSPATWQLYAAAAGDFNNDGNQDFALLLFKQGSYGDYRPFWLQDEVDDAWTYHLFVYSYFPKERQERKWRLLWGSSALKQIPLNLQKVYIRSRQRYMDIAEDYVFKAEDYRSVADAEFSEISLLINWTDGEGAVHGSIWELNAFDPNFLGYVE